MGQIYTYASEVIVWFGLEINSRALALDFLQTNMPGRQEALASKGTDESKHDLAERICDALVALCEDEYWNRTWIIQEILLARKLSVMSGTVKVEWSTLSMFLDPSPITSRLLLKPENFGEEPHSKLWHSRARLLCLERARTRGQLHEWSLKDLLAKFGHSKCSDIRDRVLGLLALADYGRSNLFEVNYSMGKRELFEYFVSFCTRSPITDGRILMQELEIQMKDLLRMRLAPRMQVNGTPVSALLIKLDQKDLCPEGPVCWNCNKPLSVIIRQGLPHHIDDYPSLFPDLVVQPNRDPEFLKMFPDLANQPPSILGNVWCVDSESPEGHFIFDPEGDFRSFVVSSDNAPSPTNLNVIDRYLQKELLMIDTKLQGMKGVKSWLCMSSVSFLSLVDCDALEKLWPPDWKASEFEKLIDSTVSKGLKERRSVTTAVRDYMYRQAEEDYSELETQTSTPISLTGTREAALYTREP